MRPSLKCALKCALKRSLFRSRFPVLLVLAALALLTLGACASRAPAAADGPPPSAETAAADPAPSGPSTASQVGGYALAVPENIVYVPWKMIGGGIKGASDGVRAGFDKGRMPLLGAIFSPVNLVTGFVTGFGEGFAMSPMLLGPSDRFGRAMAAPTKRATTIWWYP
jgi:hypothetical protein